MLAQLLGRGLFILPRSSYFYTYKHNLAGQDEVCYIGLRRSQYDRPRPNNWVNMKIPD